MKRKDIYDKEIERLTKNPELIKASWSRAEPLFKLVAINAPSMGLSHCGCLTIIRNNTDMYAYVNDKPDSELTKSIKEDIRIPLSPDSITVADLPVFAEWQRKIDKLNKVKP